MRVAAPLRALHSAAKRRVNPLMLQVWGANTGVGKTVMSAALLRAAPASASALYLKPVQSGYPVDDDSRKVSVHVPRAVTNTLVALEAPVSPDLAARLGPGGAEDSEIVSRTGEAMGNFLAAFQGDGRPVAVVETAGGVLSPAPSGSLQANLYRPFRLQAVLVGDSRLGGVSATLAAYESLRIRGYDVPVVLMFEQGDSILENEVSVERHIDRELTSVFSAPSLPLPDENLETYLSRDDVVQFFRNLYNHLCHVEDKRVLNLDDMHSRAKDVFWYPFTQHSNIDSITCIDSAYGDDFTCYTPETGLRLMVDGIGSWWTTGVGHGNAGVAKALGSAAGRYGHVMFPEAAHEPAYRLAQEMLAGPGADWASRVFFSDDGSTAVEVALKMAFRKRNADVPDRAHLPTKIVALEDCYHGDTLGVMDCAPSSDFNSKQTPWYTPRGLYFDPPSVAIVDGIWTLSVPDTFNSTFAADSKTSAPAETNDHDGKVFKNVDAIFCASRRGSAYTYTICSVLDAVLNGDEYDLGALLVEPVLMGAGGMRMVDPAFQRALVEECRRRKIPVIYDEVFTGLWRLGVESGADLLGVPPDIATYAKLLTGGTVPLALTLASAPVFDSFLGDSTREALLHGHSYTGHPLGCAAAIESLRQYRESPRFNADEKRFDEYWDEAHARELSALSNVEAVTVIGTVLAVKLTAKGGQGYSARGAARIARSLHDQDIFVRPLGNVLYLMCSPLSSPQVCKDLMRVLTRVLEMEQSDQATRALS